MHHFANVMCLSGVSFSPARRAALEPTALIDVLREDMASAGGTYRAFRSSPPRPRTASFCSWKERHHNSISSRTSPS